MNNKEFQFLLYKIADEDISVNAVVKDETIWLTQKAMAQVFGVQTPAINKHLKKIFEAGELDENMVISKMEITTQHGAIEGKIQIQLVQFYNLDAIISVGYRVNSRRATQFRIKSEKDKSSGIFAEQIWADLTGQGYEEKELIDRFKTQRGKVRQAVEAMLNTASNAAIGKADYETYDEVFAEDE